MLRIELLLLAGCGSLPTAKSGDTSALDTPTAPVIQTLTWSCDAQSATWKFEVDTAGWTGGGALWMARDSDRVERNALSSVTEAADGSTDKLELQLTVVNDWRYAVSGTSTGWRCSDADALDFLAVVYSTDGSTVTDCRKWGADTSLWDTVSVPSCDVTLQSGDTGS